MPSFEDESLLEPALAPLEPPIAPDDEPPAEPDELPEPPAGEPLAPDDEPVEPPDDPEPDEPLAPPDDPPMPPVAPALLVPLTLEPVDGLLLDEPPDRLPDEPALADEPGLLLFRLLDLSSLPRLDWSLPMPLPCLLASTPFPSLDF